MARLICRMALFLRRTWGALLKYDASERIQNTQSDSKTYFVLVSLISFEFIFLIVTFFARCSQLQPIVQSAVGRGYLFYIKQLFIFNQFSVDDKLFFLSFIRLQLTAVLVLNDNNKKLN